VTIPTPNLDSVVKWAASEADDAPELQWAEDAAAELSSLRQRCEDLERETAELRALIEKVRLAKEQWITELLESDEADYMKAVDAMLKGYTALRGAR